MSFLQFAVKKLIEEEKVAVPKLSSLKEVQNSLISDNTFHPKLVHHTVCTANSSMWFVMDLCSSCCFESSCCIYVSHSRTVHCICEESSHIPIPRRPDCAHAVALPPSGSWWMLIVGAHGWSSVTHNTSRCGITNSCGDYNSLLLQAEIPGVHSQLISQLLLLRISDCDGCCHQGVAVLDGGWGQWEN